MHWSDKVFTQRYSTATYTIIYLWQHAPETPWTVKFQGIYLCVIPLIWTWNQKSPLIVNHFRGFWILNTRNGTNSKIQREHRVFLDLHIEILITLGFDTPWVLFLAHEWSLRLVQDPSSYPNDVKSACSSTFHCFYRGKYWNQVDISRSKGPRSRIAATVSYQFMSWWDIIHVREKAEGIFTYKEEDTINLICLG